MFEVTIKKNGVITNGPSRFETKEIADTWILKQELDKAFGTPDRWINEKDLSEDQKLEATKNRKIVVSIATEATEPVFDPETGEITQDRVEGKAEVSYLEYFFPKKYEVIGPIDITAEYEAEEAAKLAKKSKRDKRKNDLDAIDWDKVDTVAKVKKVLIDVVDELKELRKLID